MFPSGVADNRHCNGWLRHPSHAFAALVRGQCPNPGELNQCVANRVLLKIAFYHLVNVVEQGLVDTSGARHCKQPSCPPARTPTPRLEGTGLLYQRVKVRARRTATRKQCLSLAQLDWIAPVQRGRPGVATWPARARWPDWAKSGASPAPEAEKADQPLNHTTTHKSSPAPGLPGSGQICTSLLATGSQQTTSINTGC